MILTYFKFIKKIFKIMGSEIFLKPEFFKIKIFL